MKTHRFSIFFRWPRLAGCFLLFSGCNGSPDIGRGQAKPNIVFIMTADWGYGESGTDTPNLFTQFALDFVTRYQAAPFFSSCPRPCPPISMKYWIRFLLRIARSTSENWPVNDLD